MFNLNYIYSQFLPHSTYMLSCL